MKGFEKLIRITGLALFTLMIVFLAIHSLFFTSEIKSNETMKYLSDRVWVHLLVISAFLAMALFIKRHGWSLSAKAENRITLLLMLSVATLSALIVWVSKSLPIFDQQLCISSANALMCGNLEQSVRGYYLNYFPFQLPWVLFLVIPTALGGSLNVMVYQFANVAAILLAIGALAECGVLMFENRKLRLLTWLGALAFLPLMFYAPFVYGNLFGLGLMLLGTRRMLLYLRERKIRHLIWLVVWFTLASLIKKNIMIAAVAAFLVLVADALRNKRAAGALAAAVLLAASFGGSSALFGITHALTGADLSQGFPTSSFVMMGLQEEEGHEPGWYNNNSYRIYLEANRNSKAASEMAVESIRERLAVFAADPAYAASFFYRKVISQWDEPSFQSLWVNEMARNPERGALALSIYQRGKAGKAVLWWMNQYQSLILIGAVLWLFLCAPKQKIGVLFFPLYFVGGFLFHLVWEAKAQYTLFYFFCLIPYAAMGYKAMVNRLDFALHKRALKRMQTLATHDGR